MITIDQARIDAPKFPRSQEWWDGFTPVWAKATVRDDGTVTFEPSGNSYDYGGPDCSVIVHQDLTAVQHRKARASIAAWVGGLQRLAVAIVDES